jgi:formylmethanofuran dehydrogenase subunit D
MSKTTAQPLNPGDQIVVTFDKGEGLILASTTDAQSNTFIPMCINSNYTCQAAVHQLNTAKWADAGIELKLKISTQNSPKVADGETLLMNNYVNGDAKYTKFDFANLPAIITEEEWRMLPENSDKTPDDYKAWAEEQSNKRIAAFKLNIGIPKNTFGLIALYYIKDVDEENGNGAYIKAHFETESRPEGEGIEFFNAEDSLGTQKFLNDGLNIIKLTPEVKQLEMYSDTAKKSIVIFGSLDIIKGINPKLDYRITNGSSSDTGKFDQLLQDIHDTGVAQDFYYNIPIQRSAEIDLNPAIKEDILSNPLAWYDPNNVNRKFVISEIDADYLSTGITLTKSSRA